MPIGMPGVERDAAAWRSQHAQHRRPPHGRSARPRAQPGLRAIAAQAPRLPTMGRFETGPSPAPPAQARRLPVRSWQAVLTGARWAGESRSAQHADGDPGNPAGPDVRPGVAVTGALTYDLALHLAQRRPTAYCSADLQRRHRARLGRHIGRRQLRRAFGRREHRQHRVRRVARSRSRSVARRRGLAASRLRRPATRSTR